ncbi:MAG TPA: type I polyketide synthase, partial [Anaerolineae bacterium]|nr:type I polyketide synthase [Anaerolineae bacterium]
MTRAYDGTEIAIIGMAGRFPGAKDIDQFWVNLRDGVEGIKRLDSAENSDPNFVPVSSAINDYDKFDAGYFDYSPRDAEITDPQQRVFLETCVHALENAGCDPSQYKGLIGVMAGSTTSNYLIYNLSKSGDQLRHIDAGELDIGNGADFLATRVSYKLNLRGPSFTVQTACSTSLVAVHLACQALLNDESDLMLAGGVSIHVDHPKGYTFVEGSIVSPDGHCRSYDAQAAGTVFGGGVGVVALKRLEDALADGDLIHAIILGSAINNDGSDKVGYPAPGVDGQAAVIAEALSVSGVDVETIQYNEGHGSGTALGDPIEVLATTKAYRSFSDAPRWGWLGSVKSNIGHTTGASGIAGLIKTTLALENAQIPPTLHFNEPNPAINFDDCPFYPNAELRDWETANGNPRRAGVSSFGLGGTNAHVILEQAPVRVAAASSAEKAVLLPISAKSAAALQVATAQLGAFLAENEQINLADVAWTLQIGRTAHTHRRIVNVSSYAEVLSSLRESGSQASPRPPAVAFVFPEQPLALEAMRVLYKTQPVFRAAFDECVGYFPALQGVFTTEGAEG